jgi:hypothetical protein
VKYNGSHQEPKQWSNDCFLVSIEALQCMRPDEGKMCSNNFHYLSPINGNVMHHCGLQLLAGLGALDASQAPVLL